MTTIQAVDEPNIEIQQERSKSRVDIAVSIAGYIATNALSNGERAELRRMDPDHPDVAVFWRLMAQYHLLDSPKLEKKWALIIHGIALMTPKSPGDGQPSNAHNGYNPVGRALFLGSGSQPGKGFYSESRLNRLLTSRGQITRTLLVRMFRMLAPANVSFNWREMARFILNEGYNEVATDKSRQQIAKDYYRTQYTSSQTTED